jgi:KRAB domain-containing zinc finger protein
LYKKTYFTLLYSAGFCGLQFYTEQDLQFHDERIHQGTNPFIKIICEQCGQTVIKNHLNAHIKQKHTPQEKKVCPECGKILTSEKRLKIHIRSVHKQEKRHRCQVCMTPFVWKSGADLCYAMHSGRKGVNCELCTKVFYTVQQKITHRVTAHPKVPRNYLCDQCEYVGGSLAMLKQHLSELHS